jgi:hypothetical protein
MTKQQWAVAMCVLFAGGVVGGLISARLPGAIAWGQEDEAAGEVRATSLVIVDGGGAERARLGAYEGGYGLVLQDSSGVARALLTLQRDFIAVDLAVERFVGSARAWPCGCCAGCAVRAGSLRRP